MERRNVRFSSNATHVTQRNNLVCTATQNSARGSVQQTQMTQEPKGKGLGFGGCCVTCVSTLRGNSALRVLRSMRSGDRALVWALLTVNGHISG